MTGLALILALAIGQDCPDGSCAQRASGGVQVTYDQERSPEFDTGWRKYCVRVHAGRHGGSGTIIGTHEGKGLVITARHVLDNPGPASIMRNGQTYPATRLVRAATGDLAALEFDNPPSDIKQIGIADKPGQRGTMFGFGPDYPGTFHAHQGRYLGRRGKPHVYNAEWLPDDEYAFNSENGDSGGGVFDDQGHLSGVLWGGENGKSNVVSTVKLRQFLEAPATEERIFTLSPFFIKCRRISRGPTQAPQRQPVQYPPDPSQGGVTVQAPGVAVQVGPQGPQGPPGISPDLTALTAQVKANAAAIGQLTAAFQQLQSQPGVQGPPGPQGTAGAPGPRGTDGAPGKDASNTTPPLLRMNATNAAGAVVSTKDYAATVDPATGRLIYNVTMSPLTTLTTTP